MTKTCTEERTGWRHWKIAIYKPRREVSTNSVDTLIFDAKPPELWENKFLLFKPPSLWYISYGSPRKLTHPLAILSILTSVTIVCCFFYLHGNIIIHCICVCVLFLAIEILIVRFITFFAGKIFCHVLNHSTFCRLWGCFQPGTIMNTIATKLLKTSLGACARFCWVHTKE